MKSKGFTLIEVILAFALIGLLAVAFLPGVTFSVKNVIESRKFTKDLFQTQQLIEAEMQEKRKVTPVSGSGSTLTKKIFGRDVVGHVITADILKRNAAGIALTLKHGEINVFLPKQNFTYIIPVITSPPVIKVKKSSSLISPQPTSFNILDNTISMDVAEIVITNATKPEFLLNVYRWYLSDQVLPTDPPSINTKDYTIIKEWNEARKILSYVEAKPDNFIPNIKEKYNELKFSEFNETDENLIHRFGGRYIRYSVTPYSIIGKIGKEEISNAIYINEPIINIINAKFLISLNPELAELPCNKILITFDKEIKPNEIDISNMNFNSSLGDILSAYSPSMDNKSLIVEFKNPINAAGALTDNSLNRKAVVSKEYGEVGINNGLGNKFTLNKKIVKFDGAAKYNILPVNINRSIDISGNGTADTTPIIIWDTHNSSNQQWYIISINDSQYSYIVSQAQISKALIDNGINSNIIRNNTNNNLTNQHWLIEKENDKFIIRSRNNIEYSMGVANTNNDAKVQLISGINYWVLSLTK